MHPRDHVRHKDGLTFLEGVDQRHRPNSVTGALARLLNAIGEPITYARAMGLSGAAFRTQIATPEWCPSAPSGAVGYETIKPLMRALGRHLDWPERPHWAEAIRAAIDRGHPVFHLREEAGLITGYRESGHVVLIRRFACEEDTEEPLEGWTWDAIAVLEETKSPPTERTSLLHALHQAVDLWRPRQFGSDVEGTHYLTGAAAFAEWISGLNDRQRMDAGDAEARYVRQLANAWMYECLADARKAAWVFLQEIAGEISELEDSLCAIAQLYKAEADVLAAVGPPPYPLGMPHGKTWHHDERVRQADVLNEAREIEAQAVERLDRVLTTARG